VPLPRAVDRGGFLPYSHVASEEHLYPRLVFHRPVVVAVGISVVEWSRWILDSKKISLDSNHAFWFGDMFKSISIFIDLVEPGMCLVARLNWIQYFICL
jgi:hypothetical protein